MVFLTRVFLAGLAVALFAGAALRSRARRRARSHAPQLESDYLLTADGEQLPLAPWMPEGEPSAVLLGLHGYGDYRQAFELAGRWLSARGGAVYAYDQRGFGETRMAGAGPASRR